MPSVEEGEISNRDYKRKRSSSRDRTHRSNKSSTSERSRDRLRERAPKRERSPEKRTHLHSQSTRPASKHGSGKSRALI